MTFADRHAVLARGYGRAEDPAEKADVLAMPMVLNIPKVDPPARSDLLAAAASSTLALCLDERVDVGGEWHDPFVDWTEARIRKVSRRARGSHWTAVQDLDGVTARVGDAMARAFVPGRVGDLDPLLSKLQIGGTDLPDDLPGPPQNDVPVLWVQRELDMTVGKAAAQVGHSVMLLAGAMPADAVARWSERHFVCAVRDASPQKWAQLRAAVGDGRAVAVRDAGFTEVAPGSMTVVAMIPSNV